ncbi:hypothetical protein [Kitasatospora sp. NPDC088346]|uniref:hypothetical protein n=1 Tax=Kitasatospora sp. NPDC088346 TaxID=3364073 RepID=UPI0037FCE083
MERGFADAGRETTRPADPTDRVVVTLTVAPGGTRWMSYLISGQSDPEGYVITVTERFMRIHRVTGLLYRPREPRHTISRPDAARRITGVRRGHPWSSFRFVLPGAAGEPTRLNVRRHWRPELDRFTAVLAADTVRTKRPARATVRTRRT